MKTLVPRREIKMYTLLSTFPLHDTLAGSADSTASRMQRNKFSGNASATRDVISSERVRLRQNPNDRKSGGEV
jgi:hypothetical protein